MVPFESWGTVSYLHFIATGRVFDCFDTIRERDRQTDRRHRAATALQRTRSHSQTVLKCRKVILFIMSRSLSTSPVSGVYMKLTIKPPPQKRGGVTRWRCPVCLFVCLSPTRTCRALADWPSSAIVLAAVSAAGSVRPVSDIILMAARSYRVGH